VLRIYPHLRPEISRAIDAYQLSAFSFQLSVISFQDKVRTES